MEPYVISAIAFMIKGALWGALVLWGLTLGRKVFAGYRDPEFPSHERAWDHRVQLLLFVVVTIALTSVSQREYGYRPQAKVESPAHDQRMKQVDREARDAESIEIPVAEGDKEEKALMSEDVLEENQRENREAVEDFKSIEPATPEEDDQ